MASSKTFVLLGLLFAVTLLISSQVSARELIESTTTATTAQTGEQIYTLISLP